MTAPSPSCDKLAVAIVAGPDLIEHSPIMPAPTLPPRPNPGPEPWPGPAGFDSRWLAAALPVGAALAWWIARKRRVAAVAPPVPGGEEPADTPELVRLAERVREALASRFGSAWIAKTTEEIADASASLEGFNPEPRDVLLSLLREADLVKFSDRDGPLPHGEDLRSRVETALTTLAADGVRSTRNGR